MLVEKAEAGMSDDEFQAFPKIPRLNRGCVITEKLDGTNAQIAIGEDGSVRAGSRSRWVTADDDNYGFAAWVAAHRDELLTLGPGRHYGEWWGAGIQRRYGLSEKRFSLFNTGRWLCEAPPPECCHVVPLLYQGEFSTHAVDAQITWLRITGSVAAPGFMRPEGVVVYLPASKGLYKVTLEGDDRRKGETS